MTKTKEEMLSALTQNIPKEEIVPKENTALSTFGPSDETLIKDSEEDFALARENVKKLLTTSDEAIGTLLNLATDAEHPRAFEVLGNFIKTAADVNKQLIDLARDRKKLVRDNDGSSKKGTSIAGNVTNNAIFVGTTSDLQKKLKERALNPILDVDEVS
jgi:hypothetical protein